MNKNHIKKLIILAALVVGGSLMSSAQAQTVTYSTTVSDVPLAFTSNGAVDDQVLTWTLGYFNDNFTPTGDNAAAWGANWNVVGESNYNHLRPVGKPFKYWAMSANATPDTDITSKTMWIFAHNSLGQMGTPGGEALLYTQGQNFPAIQQAATFDIANNGEQTDAPFTVVWGQVDRNLAAAGGVRSGTGSVFSSQLPDSTNEDAPTFEAQSATWAAVPETSSALLSLLGSVMLLNRRRR